MSIQQNNFSLPKAAELQDLRDYAEYTKKTGNYKGLISKHGDEIILLILLTARELNIPPMAALNGGLQIISSKIELSSHMKVLKIRQAGHSMTVSYSTDGSTCTVLGKRKDTGDSISVSYSLADAKKACLDTVNWKKHPKDMLYARCITRLSNQLFPDVIGGITYAPGEVGGDESHEMEDMSESEPIEEISVEQKAESLYDLFPGDESEVARFITEKMEAAKTSVEKMIEAMYKNKTLFKERFLAWKCEDYVDAPTVQSAVVTDKRKEEETHVDKETA